MATRELKNIFLSASIPLPESDPKYVMTADIIAIRDAVIALTATVIPKQRLIWGGHPSITPLINYVLNKQNRNIQEHVKIYQSLWFEDQFPKDNNEFKNIVFTKRLSNKRASIELLRKRMLTENSYTAAVFIGGMDGVLDEYNMFVELFPNAIIIPLASTGAATRLIYDKVSDKNDHFLNNYCYASIFQKQLIDKL